MGMTQKTDVICDLCGKAIVENVELNPSPFIARKKKCYTIQQEGIAFDHYCCSLDCVKEYLDKTLRFGRGLLVKEKTLYFLEKS